MTLDEQFKIVDHLRSSYQKAMKHHGYLLDKDKITIVIYDIYGIYEYATIYGDIFISRHSLISP
jgi:hypothetical protein